MPLYSLFKKYFEKLSCLYNKLFHKHVVIIEQPVDDKGSIDVISCKVKSITKKQQ